MMQRYIAALGMGSLVLTVSLSLVSRAGAAEEVPVMPHSLAEAVQMERADALPRTALYDTPSLAATRPGALLKQERTSAYSVPAGVTTRRILYHSLDASGRDVATSAVLLIPTGTAPAGGWPVIAWAHGTSGVARQCAPSLEKDMEYGEEGLWPMVRAGFAVVATDYHGLGTEGPHQYVNKLAQAHDVIYSVSAARTAIPALSKRWVVVGHSQGGLAAWSVAEMEASLADPDFLGAVSVAGAADMHGLLAGMSNAGTDAAYYLVYMAYAIHALEPSFQPKDMLSGYALEHYHAVTTEGCWNYAYASFLGAPPGLVLVSGWDRHPAVQHFVEINTLGEQPIRAPLLVIAGEGDKTVPLPLLKKTVLKACGHGIGLEFHSYPGLDHDPTMATSTPDIVTWVRAREAGSAFHSNCASISASN
jgi:pimeloyl-ACP methyl ester carboxylesterase